MPTVEENIEVLDAKIDKLLIRFERGLMRAERRLLVDLEDSVGRREVRKALNLAGNLSNEVESKGLQELADEISVLYGNVMRDIRSVFQDSNIDFRFSKADLSDIQLQTDADFNILETRIAEYAAKVKAGVLKTTYAGGDVDDVEAIVSQQRDSLLRSLRADLVNALQAFRNAVTVRKAEDSGVERLLYAGPKDKKNRPFCAAHVGKTYTLTEVENMINDQGGPALTDMGGYNCRHEWRPVDDQGDEKRQANQSTRS